MSTPQSRIYVCSGVTIDNSYTHTLYFNSLNEQIKYFQSKVSRTLTEYTYLRRNFDIKVDADIKTAQFWNYLYFTNNDGKYYFYFITSVEYKSDTTVILHLEMDVIQTYMFNWDLKHCFIERMTPVSDEIGENTIDEGLELGELGDYNGSGTFGLSYYYLMVMASISLDHYSTSSGNPYFWDSIGMAVGDVYSGLGIYACDIVGDTTVNTLNSFWDKVAAAGKTDAIVSMWLYPKSLVERDNTDFTTQGDNVHNTPFKAVKSNLDLDYNINVNLQNIAGGAYTPKNKKLLTYPYNMLHVFNHMGVGADFRLERFENLSISAQFMIEGSIFPDGGVRLVPKNYNGQGFNYEHAITLTGFPTVAWTGDAYKIWLAQNQHQQNASMASSVTSSLAGVGMMVGGALSGNAVLAGSGAVSTYSGLTQINQLLAQQNDMKTLPDQARGTQSASVNASNGTLVYRFTNRSITPERARIIDDYFTVYGYKQLIVEKPTIHNRKLFTYIKTRGCSVSGEICNDDKRKIASIFDNGVTFWTSPADVGRYDLDNGIL